MPRPGPSVTSGADLQPGSDSLFPSGFTGGGARPSAGSVGTGEIADGSVASADLNLSSVATALAGRSEFTGTYANRRARFLQAPGAPRARDILASASSPTVSTSATPPSGMTLTNATIGGPFMTFCAGGNFINNAGANGYTAAHQYPQAWGQAGGFRNPFRLLFGFDGVKAVVKFTSAPGNFYRVRVDGQAVTSWTPVAGAQNGSTQYLTIDFTTPGAASRIIGVDLVFGDVWGVYTASTESLWAVQPKGPRTIVAGDSWLGGAGAPTTGYCGISSWMWDFADRLGWEDVWNSGIGGSGWLARNGTVGAGLNALTDRYAADITAFSPDVVILQAGKNDNPTYTATQIGAAVTTVVTGIRASLPSSLIVVAGPNFPSAPTNGTVSSTWAPYQTAISAAAAAAGADLVLDTTAPNIFTGTGKAGSTTGTGNGDIYIQSDGAHPNQAGADYYGDRMAQLILAALRRAV